MIKRIGIIANLEKLRVGEAVCECLTACERRGIEVVPERDIVEHFDLSVNGSDPEDLPGHVDLLMSFGGDGTFLRAARLAGETATPLLGINLGSLGFLAEVRLEELPTAIEAIDAGEYMLEKRRRVAAVVLRGDDIVFEAAALNDIVLNMGGTPRAVDFEVLVDDIRVGRYLADGMIVATPTGSTAYNLSAGGPIVEPSMDAVVVNPICPHTLGVRPLILGPGRVVELRLRECDAAILSADGQITAELRTGDRIVYPRTDAGCYFLRLRDRNVFQIIQEKLRWGGLPRHRGDRAGGREADPEK